MSEIRKLRKERKMSVPDLASAVGISAVSVYRYEQGLRTMDVNTAAKIARVFKCSIEELIQKKGA